MNAPTALATDKVVMRTEPIQQRSSERITRLLDAAASLIDDSGIDGVTTSAAAARNMDRYLDLVWQGVEKSGPEQWSSFDSTLDAFVSMSHNEPGFRALRFGDVIDQRCISPELSNNAILARSFAEQIGSTYEFEPDETRIYHVEVAVEIASGLLYRAFQLDKKGDERSVETDARSAATTFAPTFRCQGVR